MFVGGTEMVRMGGELVMSDGRIGLVYPLTFGRARLCIGQEGSGVFDDEF